MTLANHTFLVTGGTGYIGSHTVVQLLAARARVVILDNLCNSSPDVVARIAHISGVAPVFIEGDVRDATLLRQIFSAHSIDAVLHFAGLKAVGEGEAQPLVYYDNNIVGSLNLCATMAQAGVKTLVFSSSATVYGDPDTVCYDEHTPLQPVNVYGRSKRMVEDLLRDLKKADAQWRIALLRYFNPVGAHPSGLIGEAPNGVPNNLMPVIAQVAAGQRDSLAVFGDDYPTPDGTGKRDYIHVDDLATGHLAALEALQHSADTLTLNLGTGRAHSVLEIIAAFERAAGRRIPYHIAPRRAGDLAEYYADSRQAEAVLGWTVRRSLDEMCASMWRFQQQAAEQ